MRETRKARRYDCSEVVDCFFLGSPTCFVLTDVSLLGARLRGEGVPQPGTMFMISPVESGLKRTWVSCQVCWVQRGDVGEAGIRFMEPTSRLQQIWVGELIGRQPAERRNAVRVPTELHVEVQLAGLRRPIEATSLDLSRSGTQVRLPRTLRRGAVTGLYLCLPWTLLEIPAQVTRRDKSDRLLHSLRFLQSSPHQEDALGCFLRESMGTSVAASTP